MICWSCQKVRSALCPVHTYCVISRKLPLPIQIWITEHLVPMLERWEEGDTFCSLEKGNWAGLTSFIAQDCFALSAHNRNKNLNTFLALKQILFCTLRVCISITEIYCKIWRGVCTDIHFKPLPSTSVSLYKVLNARWKERCVATAHMCEHKNQQPKGWFFEK